MENVNKASSSDEILKNDKIKKSVTRKRNTYNTTTQRTTKANKSITANKLQNIQDIQDTRNKQDMQDSNVQDNIESINLKSTDSNNEIVYNTQLKDETSQTKQHGFFKDLWYSLREYFS
ncbi:hypothetical protein EDL79_00270 [Ehrlichia ruminantium]|uniref:Uncharacterized protein n=1 Tax=Ehrlichia ruminantium TaxID=779 RepID=A0AAE6UKD9_EHRRU|nr:hypothetical protein [Ehrlichia ruminantium]QGR02138.1 hypothetical protein EDL81_00270 [Ehrlichia ruminantium]QGR03058.1 hypothetical protein EDL80_00270 [Ehrlichia ruminantium]QGR03983.1 hypothetical protein EDL79_00270 [Ehrlichia ruminantium]